jgi:FSR family fosmidomycin resistance protein-like MFS transporter
MPKKNRSKTYFLLLLILSTSHLLNDLMQSLIPASYPLLKEKYALSFVQIGLISLTFQISGALLQPVVGLITDRKAAPYSPVIGMVFTFSGLISLAFAQNYQIILISVVLIGIGSSIFHPEATRMARYAAGNRQGFAQGVFQVGGQTGGALGPIFAAIILVPWGLSSLSIFATFALLAMILLVWIGSKQHEISIEFSKNQKDKKNKNELKILSPFTIFFSLSIMIFLVFTKNFYTESFRSFYTFYLIEHFGLSIQASQLMLFIFLFSAALGVLIGGIIGDKIGRYWIIVISILGPLPLTLILPHADLFWTGILTILINLIMASAFASILIYSIDLLPNRIGFMGGLFYGLNFGLGGIAAGLLGLLTEEYGIETTYLICSFMPLAGLVVWFLPRTEN